MRIAVCSREHPKAEKVAAPPPSDRAAQGTVLGTRKSISKSKVQRLAGVQRNSGAKRWLKVERPMALSGSGPRLAVLGLDACRDGQIAPLADRARLNRLRIVQQALNLEVRLRNGRGGRKYRVLSISELSEVTFGQIFGDSRCRFRARFPSPARVFCRVAPPEIPSECWPFAARRRFHWPESSFEALVLQRLDHRKAGVHVQIEKKARACCERFAACGRRAVRTCARLRA